MPSLAYIQLKSFGDIISLLPICKAKHNEGYDVSVVTRPEHANLLDGVSYANAIACDLPNGLPFAAEEYAKTVCGIDETVVCQTYANPKRTNGGASNYQTLQWERCGMLRRFHELPLVFDRIDEGVSADDIAWRDHFLRSDGRPILAYNLSGVSQPYRHAAMMKAWIESTFPNHRKLDLGAMILPKIQDLIQYIAASGVLLTVDTATAHLSHAPRTPTIVLWPENDFARSEPRAHWIHATTHNESITPQGLDDIAAAITGPSHPRWSFRFLPGGLIRDYSEMTVPLVFHAVDYFWQNEAEKARVMDAYRTWDHHRVVDRHFRTIFNEHPAGEKRTLAEIIDPVAKAAEPQDVIVWTDRFSPLPEGILPMARKTVDCIELAPGAWAFTKGWWAKVREEIGSELDENGIAAIEWVELRSGSPTK